MRETSLAHDRLRSDYRRLAAMSGRDLTRITAALLAAAAAMHYTRAAVGRKTGPPRPGATGGSFPSIPTRHSFPAR